MESRPASVGYPAETCLGIEPVSNTPAEAAKLVSDEIERWSTVIKAAGIKPE
jgi:tripartite-type tricarboxylate transporter receptor subunit TctC